MSLATRAELDKLAVTLQRDPDQLAFLRDVAPAQLRALRIAVYERIFEDDRRAYQRLARLGARLPRRIAARRLGPLVGPAAAARVAAEMPSRRALEFVEHFDDDFVVEASEYLDPRRTREALRGAPRERVVAIARALAARGDVMTMSRFVEFLPDETTAAVVEAIEDEALLLRVAFYMGSKTRIDHVVAMLPDERRRRLIRAVQERADELLAIFLSVLVHVSYRTKRELVDIAADEGEELLEGFVRATHAHHAWAEMLPVVAAMSERARTIAVNVPVLREPDVQAQIVRAADEHGLWSIVLGLVDAMGEENRDAVAAQFAELEPQALARAAEAALMGERWEALLDIVRRLPDERRAQFGTVVAAFGEVDPELAARVAARAAEVGVT